MATWLHENEVYASLAAGEPGAARDWALTRLALAAPERFNVFPDEGRHHDMVLAAAPPGAVDALIEALHTRRPCMTDLAAAASAVGMYGLLPEDTAPLAEAVKGALREDGHEADLWLALALANLGASDARAMAAAARVEIGDPDWILPVVVLRTAEAMDALADAAVEVGREVRAMAQAAPHLLAVICGALGIPGPLLVYPYEDPEQAVELGAAFAHAHPPDLRRPQGGATRRTQRWVQALLEGLESPAAALLRAAMARDPHRAWGIWPAAAASWLRARASGPAHGDDDVIHDVLFHGGGDDPFLLSAARRKADASRRQEVLRALQDQGSVQAALMTLDQVRASGGDSALVDAIFRTHGGAPDVDQRLASITAVAGFSDPEAVVRALRGGSLVIGLLCAEWTPTAEVLEALLEVPVPADPRLRRQLSRCLAAMADPAAVPRLVELVAADPALDEDRRLAEVLLGTAIPLE